MSNEQSNQDVDDRCPACNKKGFVVNTQFQKECVCENCECRVHQFYGKSLGGAFSS